MIKAIAAAAFMSLTMCSAASANTIASAASGSGLTVSAASEAIQVTDRGGRAAGTACPPGEAADVVCPPEAADMRCSLEADALMPPEAAVSGADTVAAEFTDVEVTDTVTESYGYFGGDDDGDSGIWGYGSCTWVGPLRICP